MGTIVTRTNVACVNVSVTVVLCFYFCEPNFIPIIPILLMVGILLLVVVLGLRPEFDKIELI